MKVGDLVVLSARGARLNKNMNIAHYHAGYGLLARIEEDYGGRESMGYVVHWFDKHGEYWRKKCFDRYEIKKFKKK